MEFSQRRNFEKNTNLGIHDEFGGARGRKREARDLPPRQKTTFCIHMSTVTEVEAVLEKFTPAQLREVADWLSARLMSEETPEMLAAIDEGLRSLETEPMLSAEEVRQNIRAWVTK